MFHVGDAVFRNLGQVISRQDDVLLGRGTYDYWREYWPTSDVQPFADFINATPNHVFTSSRPAQTWSSSLLVRESWPPTLAGRGRRLFDTAHEVRRLYLDGVDTDPTGVLAVRYTRSAG
jgi:dihydrofolate reductase